MTPTYFGVVSALAGTVVGAGITQFANLITRRRDQEEKDRLVLIEGMRLLAGMQAHLKEKYPPEFKGAFPSPAILYRDIKILPLQVRSRRYRRAATLISILKLDNEQAIEGALEVLQEVLNKEVAAEVQAFRKAVWGTAPGGKEK